MSCPICLENIKNRYTTQCNHHFCSVCIFKWLCIHQTCPLCRKKINKIETPKYQPSDFVKGCSILTSFLNNFNSTFGT